MFLPFSLYLLLLASFAAPSEASSKPPRSLKRLAHPVTRHVDIFPRVSTYNDKRNLDSGSGPLRYDDSFRLILSAFDHTFHLHLSPNNYLVHPTARITYYDQHPDTGETITNSVPLLRESVRAYQGYVIPSEHTEDCRLEDIAGVREGWSSYPELGWARITVFEHEEGAPMIYEGAFSVNGVIHHITTKENYHRVKRPTDPDVQNLDDLLIIWRDSDIMSEEEHSGLTGQPSSFPRHSEPHTCGHDRLEYNVDPMLNNALRQSYNPSLWPHLWPRDDIAGGGTGSNFVDQIGQTRGCPTSQRIVYMGVAADCAYVTKQGSVESATNKILSDWNSASSLYKSTFNVSLGIVELSVQQPTCPAQASSSAPWNVDCSTTIEQRLSLFSGWRGGRQNDGIGLWHLMSGCPTGQEVGIAWMGTLCRTTASTNGGQTVSGTGVSTVGLTEWQVVAHEIGHNFGAIHDCTDGCTQGGTSCCPLSRDTCNTQSRFVMSPVTQPGEFTFSQCTIGNICSLMSGNSGGGQTDISCLADANSQQRPLISLQMCGNGIVEEGEDCDPGANKTSPCCDSSTCKFTNNARCDPQSSTCCTQQCQFASQDTICRPSKDSRCDVEEKCTGTSGICPSDVMKPNGESCGDNNLKCASGICTSVALQCQSVGASMGLREACPQSQNTCELTCQNPNATNSCIRLSSPMIDGSPCGLAGTCVGGQCRSGNWLDAAKQWYRENLQISIPVTIAAALIIFGLIYCCFNAIFRRRRIQKASFRTIVVPPPMSPAYHQRLSSRASQLGGITPMRQSMPPGSPPGQTGRRLSRRT
ncbi:zinc metalloprotease [Marasmius fiardii PR-910]|nr:zinc metalloprotease [Marasmius fiardii PR-910]